MNIQRELFKLQDIEYKNFHARLMPTVDEGKIIGIRVPVLRKFARDFAKSAESGDFLKTLPHKYYEEDNLHAFVVEKTADFDAALEETSRFLPFIDNWATCDMFLPKVFKKSPERLLPYIYKWLESDHTYTVRYGIGLLMKLFLDSNFQKEYMDKVAEVKSDEYYVNMMIAWYFATALAKQYDTAVEYLTSNTLDTWVHNKTIQKAVESYRISKETKEYLKTLKR